MPNHAGAIDIQTSVDANRACCDILVTEASSVASISRARKVSLTRYRLFRNRAARASSLVVTRLTSEACGCCASSWNKLMMSNSRAVASMLLAALRSFLNLPRAGEARAARASSFLRRMHEAMA